MSKRSKTRQREERRKKMRALKEARRKEYESKVQRGVNSKRKLIATRKGVGRIVKDTKDAPSMAYKMTGGYVSPSNYGRVFWS